MDESILDKLGLQFHKLRRQIDVIERLILKDKYKVSRGKKLDGQNWKAGGWTMDQWQAWWNWLCDQNCQLRKVQALTRRRWGVIKEREKDLAALGELCELIPANVPDKLPDWVFEKSWKSGGAWFTFDWVFTPRGCTRIVEGMLMSNEKPQKRNYI